MTEDESSTTFEQVVKLLEERGVQFNLTVHAPCRTSAESALVRGVSLSSGAKALLLMGLLKGGGTRTVLAVMSASRKIDNKKIRTVE